MYIYKIYIYLLIVLKKYIIMERLKGYELNDMCAIG